MDRQVRIENVKEAMLSMQRDSWEQGVAAQALLELGDMRRVVLFAKEAALRQGEDGRLALTYSTTGVTDPACNGEPVLAAARETGDAGLVSAAGRMAEWLLRAAPRTDSGVVCHVMKTRQVWVDSMYMSPPFLAAAGHHGEAVRQLEGYRGLLFDPQKKLYSHMWDDEKKEFLRRDAWGVGNGWAAAGITRVIRSLPETMEAEKNALVAHLKELVDSLLSLRMPEGFFHDVVDNPDTFTEVNLSQMLCYTLYRGVKAGYLDKAYLKDADFMRQAVYQKVDEWGLVHDVCGAPFFNSPGTATEGQAFFLLMEAAYSEL